jgi:hypothetical protein
LSITDAFHKPNNELVRALRELLDAPTVEEARVVLDQKQAMLLSNVAIELLRDFYGELMREDPLECMYDPTYVGYHSVLLMGARLRGIEKGWEEAEQMAIKARSSRAALKHGARDFLRSLEGGK